MWIAGTLVTITPSGLAAGQIDGTGTTGYGTGGYGIGGWNQPSATDYFPRTWSLAAWGEYLLASPRSGTLYEWQNNPASLAVAVTNAPAHIDCMLVVPTENAYQVFAFGTNEEVSGTYNPLCIRSSSIRNNTEWSTTAPGSTAREYTLPGGGRIVGAKLIGDYILVWTLDALFLGRYVGALTSPWRFERIDKGAGLIGPNAATVKSQVAFWVSPDRQFYSYALGGKPESVPCPIRNDFADNLAASQGDKIVASSISEYGEVRFDYPDARDGMGYENSRYVALKVAGPVAGSWYRGEMARTAYVGSGPSSWPIGATYGGAAYWQERGSTADGGAISAYITSADVKLDDNNGMMVKEFWPDFKSQQGAVSVTISSRLRPQGEATVAGPYAVTTEDDKVDVLAKGLYFNVTYAVDSSPASFRVGVPVFNASPSGRR